MARANIWSNISQVLNVLTTIYNVSLFYSAGNLNSNGFSSTTIQNSRLLNHQFFHDEPSIVTDLTNVASL